MRRKRSFGPKCKKNSKRGIRIETKFFKKTLRMKIAKKNMPQLQKQKEQNPKRFIFLCNSNSNVIIS